MSPHDYRVLLYQQVGIQKAVGVTYVVLEDNACNVTQSNANAGRHGHFLNSTCDIGPSDMRQGLQIVVTWDLAFS